LHGPQGDGTGAHTYQTQPAAFSRRGTLAIFSALAAREPHAPAWQQLHHISLGDGWHSGLPQTLRLSVTAAATQQPLRWYQSGMRNAAICQHLALCLPRRAGIGISILCMLHCGGDKNGLTLVMSVCDVGGQRWACR